MTKLLNVYPPPTHVLTKVFIFCFSSSPSLPSLISYFYSTRFIAILSIIFILTLVGLPRYSRKFNSRNLQTIETGIKNFFFICTLLFLMSIKLAVTGKPVQSLPDIFMTKWHHQYLLFLQTNDHHVSVVVPEATKAFQISEDQLIVFCFFFLSLCVVFNWDKSYLWFEQLVFPLSEKWKFNSFLKDFFE